MCAVLCCVVLSTDRAYYISVSNAYSSCQAPLPVALLASGEGCLPKTIATWPCFTQTGSGKLRERGQSIPCRSYNATNANTTNENNNGPPNKLVCGNNFSLPHNFIDGWHNWLNSRSSSLQFRTYYIITQGITTTPLLSAFYAAELLIYYFNLRYFQKTSQGGARNGEKFYNDDCENCVAKVA